MLPFLVLLASISTNAPDYSHRIQAEALVGMYCLNQTTVYGTPCSIVGSYYAVDGNKETTDEAAYVVLVMGESRVLTYIYKSGRWSLSGILVSKHNTPKNSRVDGPIIEGW